MILRYLGRAIGRRHRAARRRVAPEARGAVGRASRPRQGRLRVELRRATHRLTLCPSSHRRGNGPRAGYLHAPYPRSSIGWKLAINGLCRPKRGDRWTWLDSHHSRYMAEPSAGRVPLIRYYDKVLTDPLVLLAGRFKRGVGGLAIRLAHDRLVLANASPHGEICQRLSRSSI